jgi:tetratricopeptide (TPR) repeat protein
MDISKLNQLIDVAVVERETGDLKKSREMFEEIIPHLNLLADSQNSANIQTYIKGMGEWIIQYRNEGKQIYLTALDLSINLHKFHDDVYAVRGIANTLLDAGEYEAAGEYLSQLLNLTPKVDTAKRGDTMAHIAKYLLRTGRKEEALEKITEAIKLLESNPVKHPPLRIAVWKSHALRINSLIAYLNNDLPTAQKLAARALIIAKKFKLKIRTIEAESTVRLVKNIHVS